MNFKGQGDCILEIFFVVLFVLLFSFFVMNKYELCIANMYDCLSLNEAMQILY